MNNKLLSVASFSPKSLSFPFSWVGHIPFVDFLIQQLKPKVFVELGTHSGNSYFAFCQAVEANRLNTKCYAVDTWMGDEHAGGYENDVYLKVKEYNNDNYREFSTLLRMTFDEAIKEFEDGSVDLLHIDGLHTYDAVKHDFESWLPKLAPGAVVVFHDTQVRERDFGVWKLWEELTLDYPNNIEFSHSNGLGILQLNDTHLNTLGWLKKNSQLQEDLKKYFSALGHHIFLEAQNSELINERDALINERDALINERDASEWQVSSLIQSRSWRYTAPLRFIGYYFRIGKSFLQFCFKNINNCKSLICNAWKVLRLEGFASLKNKISLRLQKSEHYDDYQKWIFCFDTPSKFYFFIQRIKAALMLNRPKFSFLLDLKDPSEFYLLRLIESLMKQTYQNWEVIILVEEASCSMIKEILKRFNLDEEKLLIVTKNVKGSYYGNEMVSISRGDWFVNIGERDLLNREFLFSVTREVNQKPNVALVYTDDDLIDPSGKRHDHFFKPDWSKDLFYSQHYLGRSVCFRKDIVSKLGPFVRTRQDTTNFDLILRIIEIVDVSQICHIPQILYHYEDRPEALASFREKLLNEHFARLGLPAKVEFHAPVFRIKYPIPNNHPLVTLIIPTKNGFDVLQKCIDSILHKTTYQNYEILIIDNGSDDQAVLNYFENLKLNPKIRVVNDNREFNYSALNNLAVGLANGQIIGLINNDVEVISDEWLTEMVSHALREEVGAVGAKLIYPNEQIQHAGVLLVGGVAHHAFARQEKSTSGYHNRAISTQDYSAVTAACLIVKKQLFIDVGGLNEQSLKVAFNDVDFCLRLRQKGYKIIWTPYAELYHHESLTRGSDAIPEKALRFQSEIDYMKSTWPKLLLDDPFYNPNLSWISTDFSLGWPPRERNS